MNSVNPANSLSYSAFGHVTKEEVTCGVCGFVVDEAGECPRCKLLVEETVRGIEAR